MGAGAAGGADSLAADSVEPLLTGRFGRPYEFRESCESTQALLGPEDPEGAAAACDEQTEGRGRLGRTWVAPAGAAILVSVLLRPPAERRAPELSLVAGVAVARTAEHALGLSAQIKWPNDVMVNRAKVAGVLAEARDGAVVLGVGLNVNQGRDELPADAVTPPGSLRTVDGVRRDRAPLLAELLAELEAQYDLWTSGGLDAVYDELGPRDFLRNRRVTVDGATGRAIGIDRSGRLVFDVGGEQRSVESGDVRYER
jgi:BirA family transcriptional regulator, biotin operon repressor / biotin---[acetyl-CoA-carboxylase] ligase